MLPYPDPSPICRGLLISEDRVLLPAHCMPRYIQCIYSNLKNTSFFCLNRGKMYTYNLFRNLRQKPCVFFVRQIKAWNCHQVLQYVLYINWRLYQIRVYRGNITEQRSALEMKKGIFHLTYVVLNHGRKFVSEIQRWVLFIT